MPTATARSTNPKIVSSEPRKPAGMPGTQEDSGIGGVPMLLVLISTARRSVLSR